MKTFTSDGHELQRGAIYYRNGQRMHYWGKRINSRSIYEHIFFGPNETSVALTRDEVKQQIKRRND